MATFLRRETKAGDVRWQARVFSRRDGHGKKIELVETFGTKKQAEKWAREKESRRDGGMLAPNKCSVGELLDDLDQDYKDNAKSPWGPLVIKTHLKPFFSELNADSMSTDDVKHYVAKRRKEGVKITTVKRELAVLHRAFTFGAECTPQKVTRIPKWRTLPKSPHREGFFEDQDYRALLRELSDEVKPILTFAFWTGCRRGEILGLRWDQVDLDGRMIRLTAAQTKTKKARKIPLAPDVVEVLKMQLSIRDQYHPTCPHVFFRHADGRRLHDFRSAWIWACKRAGLWDASAGKQGKATKLFHDLRRTAIRNLVRRGVSDSVAMKISGHLTRSVFDAYNVTDERDLLAAVDSSEVGCHQGDAGVTSVQTDEFPTPEKPGNRLN